MAAGAAVLDDSEQPPEADPAAGSLLVALLLAATGATTDFGTAFGTAFGGGVGAFGDGVGALLFAVAFAAGLSKIVNISSTESPRAVRLAAGLKVEESSALRFRCASY